MSTLRVSNIEAKADVSSPTVDEKIKFTNSSGDVLFHLDGKTSGITTVGINTTGNTFTVNNTTGDISFSGSVTSSGVSTFTSDVSISDKIVHIGDTDTAIRFSDADTILLETGGAQRLKITDSLKEVKNGPLRITSTFVEFSGDITTPSAAASLYRPADNTFAIATANAERLRITSSGNVGIGTDNPARVLHTSGNLVRFDNNASAGIILVDHQNSKNFRVVTNTVNSHSFSIEDMGSSVSGAGTARLLIDSSGRLLVGTTSTSSNNLLVVAGTTGGNPGFVQLQTKATTPGSTDQIGGLNFGTSVDVSAARIITYRDSGTWTAGSSTPTALTFFTTADGSSNPTERMRIAQNGKCTFSPAASVIGIEVNANGSAYAAQFNNSYTGDASNTVRITNSGTTGVANALNVSDNFYVKAGGKIYSLATYNNTAAASANMHVDSNGIFYRATSSAKYKTSIETLEDQYADALLDARPVWYRSTTGNEPADWGWYGFIAEEVAEIDPRLVFWKTHETEKDEDGNTVQVELDEPIAEGVQYDRFVPHLLNLIKRQKEQIEAMEARLSALESK